MKKLLLLTSFLLTLFFTSGSLQAQDCAIRGARISADTNCVFTTWAAEFLSEYARNEINFIAVNGETFFLNNTSDTGLIVRYSRLVDSVNLANCDTAGSVDLFGTISFTLFGSPNTCEFQGGSAQPECPDNVLVSQDTNCLIFEFQDGFFGAPPDTVTLNDTVFYSMGFDASHPTIIFYQSDSSAVCDTSSMNALLGDTLFIGGQVCTYAEGILPILILAFDYTSDDGRVDLAWKVNSDEVTQRLYLQKSYDGVQWVNVYDQAMEKPGSGVTTAGSYTDLNVEQSKVYYRLFVEGFHGKSNYSNVLPVTMEDKVINSVFYQSQSRSIMIQAGQNFAGEMYLYNTRGQNIMTKKVLLPKGGYVEVHVEGLLPAGIYFVRFEDSLIPPTKLFIN